MSFKHHSTQSKLSEIDVSRKSLQSISAQDFDRQSQAKRKRLKKLKLTSLSNCLILDAACGPGTYGILLAQQGNTVVGVDVSRETIALAKQRAQLKGIGYNFMGVVADLERLPLVDEVFDVCFIGWALHHFPKINVISELSCVLKRRGLMAIAEPNELHPALVISRYAEDLFKGLLGESGLFTDNVSVHTYRDYQNNLQQEGFEVMLLSTYSFLEPVIFPHGLPAAKKVILRFCLAFRDLLCAAITWFNPVVYGTDLLILASKR